MKGNDWPLLICLTLFLPTNPSYCQTSAEINSLFTKSKLVDPGRQVNAAVGTDKTTISTYSHPKATDQDCKVAALMMMKALKQQYKTIHLIHVLFYDPANPKQFREVKIREADFLLLNSGRPLQEVVSLIDIAHRKPQTTALSGFVNYKSGEGDVSVLYPQDWVPAEPGIALIRLVSKMDATNELALYRTVVPDQSLDDIVNIHESGLQLQFKDFKRINRKPQDSNGLHGIYLEATAKGPSGDSVVERSVFVLSHSRCYRLTMVSSDSSSADMNRLFHTVSASLKIQG